MRYQVRLIDSNNDRPIIVEAAEFHTIGGNTVSFLSYRTRDSGLTDQWGNPRISRQRTTVAFFSNVESVREIPDDQGEAAVEGVVPVFDQQHHQNLAPFGANPVWIEAPTPVAPAMDDDGVNWDDERVER